MWRNGCCDGDLVVIDFRDEMGDGNQGSGLLKLTNYTTGDLRDRLVLGHVEELWAILRACGRALVHFYLGRSVDRDNLLHHRLVWPRAQPRPAAHSVHLSALSALHSVHSVIIHHHPLCIACALGARAWRYGRPPLALQHGNHAVGLNPWTTAPHTAWPYSSCSLRSLLPAVAAPSLAPAPAPCSLWYPCGRLCSE